MLFMSETRISSTGEPFHAGSVTGLLKLLLSLRISASCCRTGYLHT